MRLTVYPIEAGCHEVGQKARLRILVRPKNTCHDCAVKRTLRVSMAEKAGGQFAQQQVLRNPQRRIASSTSTIQK